jgi:O-antigen/teichoic acid export membrane protein
LQEAVARPTTTSFTREAGVLVGPVLSLGLRGATLASRFLLVLALARFLTPAELGLYGLFAAAIEYAIYLIGADFYVYTTREVLQRERGAWGGPIKNQAAVAAVLWLVVFPLSGVLFLQGRLPWDVAAMFAALLVLEYLGHELGRLLVMSSDAAAASFTFFLRFGVWPPVVVAIMYVDPATRNIHLVLQAWLVGSLLAVLTSAWRLLQLGIGGWRQPVEWSWIRRGLRVALPFMVATLALRALFTIDRYWFEALAGSEVLGAYVLFFGIAGAMLPLLDAGVLAFITPRLVKAHHSRDSDEFRQQLRQLCTQTVGLVTAFVLLTVLLALPFVEWLGRPLYAEQLHLLYWLLAAVSLYAIGLIPHSALYAKGRDRPIVASHVASLVLFGSVVTLISDTWPTLAVPTALCAALAFAAAWKAAAYLGGGRADLALDQGTRTVRKSLKDS